MCDKLHSTYMYTLRVFVLHYVSFFLYAVCLYVPARTCLRERQSEWKMGRERDWRRRRELILTSQAFLPAWGLHTLKRTLITHFKNADVLTHSQTYTQTHEHRPTVFPLIWKHRLLISLSFTPFGVFNSFLSFFSSSQIQPASPTFTTSLCCSLLVSHLFSWCSGISCVKTSWHLVC